MTGGETNEKCGATLSNGHGCAFPAGRCPVYEDSRPQTAGPSDETPAASGPKPKPPAIRNLAHDALRAVVDSNASPTLATRFVNAVKAAQSMGESEWTFEEKAREAALLGSIMHGIPPRDREDWEELEKTTDPYTMLLMYRWYPWTWYEDIALDKVPNVFGGQPSPEAQIMQERKEWGARHPGWEDTDVLSDPPPWRIRIRSRFDRRPPGPGLGYQHPPFQDTGAARNPIDDAEDDDDDW